MNPFALDAVAFLILYIWLLVAVFLLSMGISAWLRPDGREQRVSEPDTLALLGGGAARLAEAAVARLMASKTLQHVGGDRFAAIGNAPVSSTLDRAILSLPMPARWPHIGRAAVHEIALRTPRLAAQGLYFDDDEAARLRLLQILPFAALLVFGTLRLVHGVDHGKPVGFLAILLVITTIITLARWRVDRRTRAAIRAVKLARVDHHRLRIAPTHDEMATAVALFGTAVLAGSFLEPLHRMRAPQSDSGGDGGGGDGGGGDGGGCGGGCGGCS